MNSKAIERMKNLHSLLSELKAVAQQRDGERINELAERYQVAAAALLQTPVDSQDPVVISEFTQLSENINRLQEEISALASPWMDDLRILLRENRKGQAINATYRSEP